MRIPALFAAACVAAAGAMSCSSTTVYGSYRKDHFLPYSTYPEASLPDPVDGGLPCLRVRR